MRYTEIFERAVESNIFGMTKLAYAKLSPAAQNAVESWETLNWTGGVLEQHIRANDAVAQEVEAAFAPVRARLPETITLYRGIIVQDEYRGWENALLQSWTTDRRVAELFAGLRRHGPDYGSLLYSEDDDSEIERVAAAYERTGFAKYKGRYYIRNKEAPQYYNIYDGSRQFVTDGDDLAGDLRRDNAWKKELNQEKQAKAKVFEEEISRDRVVWITNTLNCKEFLVLR
jgi:uncharacterized protein YukE